MTQRDTGHTVTTRAEQALRDMASPYLQISKVYYFNQISTLSPQREDTVKITNVEAGEEGKRLKQIK